METPRVYYNTITVDVDGIGFIVGLIEEVYSLDSNLIGRHRDLLAYQPDFAAQTPALPVYHEALTVLTRTAWTQAGGKARSTTASMFFTTYHDLDRLTCFQTFTPPQPATRLWHALPNDYWPALVADAKIQLQRDRAAFYKHRPATLPLAALPLHQLGYFPERD